MDNKTLLRSALIVGISLVVGLVGLGYMNASRATGNLITVTGSAKRSVDADLAKWSANFSRRSGLFNLKETIALAAADAEKVRQYAVANGLKADDVKFTPVQTDSVYEYTQYGSNNTVIGYTVRQQASIESTDLVAIEKLGKSISKLIEQGVVAEYQRTEYFYTKLADLRPELFAEATKDAQKRAEAIASGTGAKVGTLRSARTGVIQILQPNSLEVADYGAYDTSTKEKEVTATVNVSFELK